MPDQTIEITQHWLGLRPYVLIEVGQSSADPQEPALFLSCGGGAEERPLYLALLLLAETPAGSENPVADMLREVWHESEANRPGVEEVTRQFNPAWLPFVRGESG